MGWSVSVASQSSRPLFHLLWEFRGTGIKRNKGERKRWKSAVWWELPLGRGVFSKGSAWGLISGPWRRQQLLPALSTLFRYHQAWQMSLDSFNHLLIGQQHPNAYTEFIILKHHTCICATFLHKLLWAKVLVYSQLLSIQPTSFPLFLHSCVRKCWRRQGFHVVSIYYLRPFLRDSFIFHWVSAGSHICCVTMTRTTWTCCCNYL